MISYTGQALCSHCRDNTHRAKMFATHDIVHMSKCTKEPKKVENQNHIKSKDFCRVTYLIVVVV